MSSEKRYLLYPCGRLNTTSLFFFSPMMQRPRTFLQWHVRLAVDSSPALRPIVTSSSLAVVVPANTSPVMLTAKNSQTDFALIVSSHVLPARRQHHLYERRGRGIFDPTLIKSMRSE